MAIKTEIIPRIFEIEDDRGEKVTLSDPDPMMTPKQVRDHYSLLYPHITSAKISNPKINEEGKSVYQIDHQVGERG
ncbi:MAG TPA: PRTRC system protein C [Spirochaetia bacterium]|nr:PRTRC system protein C [Spirochaetia bacterium]